MNSFTQFGGLAPMFASGGSSKPPKNENVFWSAIKGLTNIEKLVAVAIIAIVLAICISAFSGNNLKARCESQGGKWGIVGVGYGGSQNYGCVRDGQIVPL